MGSTDPVRVVAIIDFETATPDPASACAVGWSLVHKEHSGWKSSGDAREMLVRPPRNDQRNTQFHGITANETSDLPSLWEVWNEEVRPVLLAAETDRLCSHNARFDAAVLWCSLMGDGSEIPRNKPYQARAALRSRAGALWLMGCSIWAAYKILPERPRGTYTLTDLAETFGIDLVNAHQASDDAGAAGAVLAELLNRDERPFDALMRQSRALFEFTHQGPAPYRSDYKHREWHNLLWGIGKEGRVYAKRLEELRRQDRERSVGVSLDLPDAA